MPCLEGAAAPNRVKKLLRRDVEGIAHGSKTCKSILYRQSIIIVRDRWWNAFPSNNWLPKASNYPQGKLDRGSDANGILSTTASTSRV